MDNGGDFGGENGFCVECACLMRKVHGSTPRGGLMTFYDLFFSHHFWHSLELWVNFQLMLEWLKSEISKLFCAPTGI